MSMIGRRNVAALALIPIITAACGGGGGSDSPSVQLPEITEQPVDREISSGSPVSFSVQVKTSTDVKFQWKKNGVNIGGTDGGTAVVDNGAVNSGITTVKNSITLNDMMATDSGSTYSVTITNAAGSIQSRGALLTVSTGRIDVIASSFMTSIVNFDDKGGSFATESNQTTGETHLIRFTKSGEKIKLTSGLEKYNVDKLQGPSRTSINAIDYKDGSIYIVEAYQQYSTINVEESVGGKITKISPDGTISKLLESSTLSPTGLVIDDTGNLFTVDASVNDLYKFTPTGELTKVKSLGAITPMHVFGITITLAGGQNGTIYSCVVTSRLTNVVQFSKDGAVNVIQGAETIKGKEFHPRAVGTFKDSTYILLQEAQTPGNQLIKEISSDGKSTIIAGTANSTGKTTSGPLPGIIEGTRFIGISQDGKIHLSNDAGIVTVTPNSI